MVLAYRENDRTGGHDPYSSSKACAELISSSTENHILWNLELIFSVRAEKLVVEIGGKIV